jgi:hypothetical protein
MGDNHEEESRRHNPDLPSTGKPKSGGRPTEVGKEAEPEQEGESGRDRSRAETDRLTDDVDEGRGGRNTTEVGKDNSDTRTRDSDAAGRPD